MLTLPSTPADTFSASVTYATASSRSVAAVIQQTPIRRDHEGRYCLNDLHKAAGGEKKLQPSNYLRLDTTEALAEAVSNSSEVRIKPIDLSRGRYGGTYVHEDLAIDYAAWISPLFKLEVYRGFKCQPRRKGRRGGPSKITSLGRRRAADARRDE